MAALFAPLATPFLTLQASLMLITSRHNEQVKLLRSLQQRKHRERTRLFLVEGPRLVREAAQMGWEIETLAVAPELLSEAGREALAAVEARGGAARLEVSPEVLLSVSPRYAAEGVLASVRQRGERLEQVQPGGAACWVAATQIGQPWSIGTMVRICAAAGGEGAVLIGDSTDPYDPTAVRASLGTVFSQRLVKASLEEFTAWKRRWGCHVVGTSPAAERDYRRTGYVPPLVVLMGSERVGLSAEQQAVCDAMVSIPMLGRCESHHVTVATAIVLYEVMEQWRGGLGARG